MPYRPVKRGDRTVKLSWEDVANQTDDVLVALTLGQIEALIALVENQRWQTRWYNTENYEQDSADAWVDDTIKRLMTVVELPDLTDITLEIEQDGTLRLKYDGSGAAEVNMKTLLDDDYVNVEGDVMTGKLTINAASSTKLTLGSNTAKPYDVIQNNTSGQVTHQSDAAFLFKNSINDWIQFHSTTQTYWSYGGVQVANLLSGGHITITEALLMNMFSSTAAWRNAADLVAGWLEDTDAIRLGLLSLAVYNFNGTRQSFMQAWATDEQEPPYLAFRGLTPVALAQIDENTSEGAVAAIFAALQDQGLIDGSVDIPTAPETPPTTPPTTELQKCRTANYVVSILSALVSDALNTIATLTPDEWILNLTQDLDMFSYALIALSATVQIAFKDDQIDDIEAELLTEFNAMVAAVQENGGTVSKDEVKAAIDDAIDWTLQSVQDLLFLVIDAITPEAWDDLIAQSLVAQVENCPADSDCAGGLINYEFDPMETDIFNGTLVLGQGLQSAYWPVADTYGWGAALTFDGCLYGYEFTVHWWNNGDSPLGIVWGIQTWNEGTQQWDGAINTIPGGAVSGENEVVIGNQYWSEALRRRFVVQSQTRNDPAHVSVLRWISWEQV